MQTDEILSPKSLPEGISLERYLPSVDTLRERFLYDAATGIITRRTNSSHGPIGSLAGWSDKHGYRNLSVNGKCFKAHRVAWAIHYGEHPVNVIDHINGIVDDNRIQNLRETTQSNNCKNQKLRITNSYGLKGLERKANGDWIATICSDGVRYYLGTFKTKEEGYAAYCGAARILHKNYARLA